VEHEAVRYPNDQHPDGDGLPDPPGAAQNGSMVQNAGMAGDPPQPGLWRNRNWRLVFAGMAVSLLGDNIFDVTIVLWVATRIANGQTWAPLAVGGALIAVAAPVMLVGPFAGVFVDRWDRRRTMLFADLVRAVLIASLLVLPLIEDRLSITVELACLYGVLALASGMAQFFNGARFALLAAIMPPSDQPRASGMAQTVVALAGIIGPPLAAPLLFSVGVGWALAANSVSFLISFALIYAMRVPARESVGSADAAAAPESTQRPSFRREFVEGARFFVRSAVLRSLMIAVVVATLGAGALNALDVFFVTDNLHTSAGALGTLGAAFGLGSVVGALTATAIGNRIKPNGLFWTTFAITGFAIMAYSRAQNLTTALVLLVVAGVPLAILNSVAGPILLSAAPQHLLGRVMSVFNPIQQVAAIIGMALVTYLASTSLRGLDLNLAGVHFGRIDSVFFAAGILFVLCGVWVGFPLRAAARRGTAAGPATPTEPVPGIVAVPGVAELAAAGEPAPPVESR
jgi:MFS family permease